jgi:AcrR family transcriptional regulator
MGRSATSRTPGNPRKARVRASAERAAKGAPARVRPGSWREPAEHDGLRKAPRQGRSRKIVETILEAAALTFAELGYAKATTNRIAARAGVSVGSLYQYFPNKDALLVRLLEDHHAQVRALIEPVLARVADPTAPLDELLRVLLRDLVAVHEARPALTRALSDAVLRQSDALADGIAHDADAAHASQLRAALAARSDVRRTDFGAMTAILWSTTSQLTRWLVHDAPPDVDRAALLDEAAELLVRYVARDRTRPRSR